ncbi:MAG: class I SAM-dependent methyltransferase [Candidatus Rokuibacteriota bacterium]
MTPGAFPDRRAFQAWNEAMAEKYDPDRFHAHPSRLVRYVEAKRVRRILALLAPAAGDRVLEVGCGGGHLLARVPAGRRLGLDLSRSLLARTAGRIGGRRGLVQGDAEQLPFRNGAVDRAYCSEVLEHLPSPAAAVAEIRRVLTPRGVMVLSVPNERLINAVKALLRALRLDRLLLGGGATDYAMPARMDDEWHLHAFDRRGLLALVPAGVRIARVEGIPFVWLPLRYVVRCEAAEAPSP